MDTPPQSAAFHRARELREEGKSLRAIADILAAESVPLPPGRATKWSHTAVVRLFRQFDTPPGGPEETGASSTKGREARISEEPIQRPVLASPPPPPPPPPPPARIDRDMPPLVGPGWVPEGWRPRLLLGLLVLALLGASGGWLNEWMELRKYRNAWAVLTPELQEWVNQEIKQGRAKGQ